MNILNTVDLFNVQLIFSTFLYCWKHWTICSESYMKSFCFLSLCLLGKTKVFFATILCNSGKPNNKKRSVFWLVLHASKIKLPRIWSISFLYWLDQKNVVLQSEGMMEGFRCWVRSPQNLNILLQVLLPTHKSTPGDFGRRNHMTLCVWLCREVWGSKIHLSFWEGFRLLIKPSCP